MEDEFREELNGLLSFGVVERERRYEASRAIMKFFDRHPNFKHCDARKPPDGASKKPPTLRDWNFWPSNGELPSNVKMAFYRPEIRRGEGAAQTPLNGMFFLLCSGAVIRLEDFTQNLSQSEELMQQAKSVVMANAELHEDYFDAFLDASAALVTKGEEMPLKRFISSQASPFVKHYLPYEHNSPPGVTIWDEIGSVQFALLGYRKVAIGRLRLPEDEESLQLLQDAFDITRFKVSNFRITQTISDYYRASDVSIDVVRQAVVAFKFKLKNIPEKSIWQASRLRPLATNSN